MRTFAEETYGIPPGQVIGSSGQVSNSLVEGVPTPTEEAKIGSIDDKEGKPVNIHLYAGKQPILAFGNSDGDQQMLEYTGASAGSKFCLLVHHDDTDREYAYDREDPVDKLDTAWDEVVEMGWIEVSMKEDLNRIFPFSGRLVTLVVRPVLRLGEFAASPTVRVLKHAQQEEEGGGPDTPAPGKLEAQAVQWLQSLFWL